MKPILKYLIVSVFVFIPLFILSEKYLEYDDELAKFLPNLLLYVLIGIVSYAILTYLIDSKTKKFYNSIIHEITKKMK